MFMYIFFALNYFVLNIINEHGKVILKKKTTMTFAICICRQFEKLHISRSGVIPDNEQ